MLQRPFAYSPLLQEIGGVSSPRGRQAANIVANPVPSTLARIISGNVPAASLRRPGATHVFVTAAEDIAGLNASQVAQRLTIPQSSSAFKVIEFSAPQSVLASPDFRANPGFIGGGRTLGGARGFVNPNGKIPSGLIIKIVP
jgi:hypothetical protein